MAELISRLWAVHRRSTRQASEIWNIGDISLEPRSKQVWLEGELLSLSLREYQLLLDLALTPGALVSKSKLGIRLAPLSDPVEPAAIEVHMSNLRRKIDAERIRSVRGVGYQLLS